MGNHTIGIKLAVAFGLLVAILVGVGWLGLSRMRRINADLNEIFNRRWVKAELAREAISNIDSIFRITVNVVFLDHKDRSAVDALLASRTESTAKISAIQATLERTADSGPERALLASVRETRIPARQSLQHLLDLLAQDSRSEAARQETVNVTIPRLNTYHIAWNDFMRFEEQEMAKATNRAQASYEAARRLTSLLIILAIVLTVGIVVFLTRTLTEEGAKRDEAEAEIRRLNDGLEKKVAERMTEHKKLEDRFQKAFNASPEPIVIATILEGMYIDVNESFLRTMGYRREEVIGRTSFEIKFWERAEDRLKLTETLKEQGRVRDLEINFCTKSGEQRTGLQSAEIIEIGGEKCILSVFKDITEQKSMEKQLRQSQKMEAIGQLSGGIAHDFNNLLSVIIGYSEIMEESLTESDPLHKKCLQIKKAGQSAASLTRQLLAFSRQQVLEPKILDMNSIVVSVEKMLQRLIGEHIALRAVLDPKLGQVKADQGQMEQVIMNLVVNARDAMPEGGKLTIETSNVELDEDYARKHVPQLPGSYVLLTVSDTGIGMDATTQSHIFEPFFTTKGVGKGTGLGLSTVYGVVRQSKGHIWVYSQPGLGTSFKIYLPRTAEVARPQKPPVNAVKPFHGTETILLVEDNESVRELARTMLADGGYLVLEAECPEKAIEIAREHSGPIHLLLTDVIMPGWNGPTLARNLGLLRPEMRVLYMSGYTGFTHPEILDFEAPLLSKPFTRETLLRKLHEELAREHQNTA